MKKISAGLLGLTLASAVALPAGAADFGGYKGAPPPYVVVPLWNGFYAGVNGGGGESANNGFLSPSGGFGGGQIGYNWQANNVFNGFVFGVEADFGGTGFSSSHHPFNNVLLHDNEDAGFYADLTGRLGYAFGPTLFYIKGGWAWFDSGRSLRADAGSVVCPLGCSIDSNGISGWTFGGGLEYKFAPSWGAKVEYQHFDFGNFNQDLTPLFDSRFDRNLTADAVTVGVNYYFGGVYTPMPLK